MEDVPMSDEARSHLMAREARFAVEDFQEDLLKGMKAIGDMLEKFHEDPDEQGMVVMLMVTLTMETMYNACRKSVEGFRKRTGA